MKRILSLLLCLCLLLGVVLTAVACKPKAPAVTEIDLKGYKVIYDDSFTAGFKAEMSALTLKLRTRTGTTFKSSTSGSSNAQENEILVGTTSREESATLKGKIKGDGYAIGVVNGKLVITGTSPLLTQMALNRFHARYLSDGETGTVFTIVEEVVSNVEMITLDDSYVITYSSRLDDSPSDNPGRVDEDENPEGFDYPVVAAKGLRENLKELVKLKSTSFNVVTDAKDLYNKEILVGVVDRKASEDFVKVLAANEFGIRVDGSKLVVMGHNDVTLRSAAALFKDVIKAGAVTEDSKTFIRIPASFTWTQTKSNDWTLNYPQPDGLELAGSVDVGEGSFEMYYNGVSANLANYEAYCEKLKGEGYTVVMENTIEGSVFRTFVHEGRSITLHVTYAAHSHAFSENLDLFEPCIRIVSASTKDHGNKIPEELKTADYSYAKITDTTLTGVRFDYSTGAWGNDYVLQLEDGSFFIQDGGSTAGKDYERLYAVLCDLFYRSHGVKPTSANPIIVAGWYLSHGHGDHYGNFYELIKRYKGTVRLEYIFTNLPSDEECYNVYDPNLTIRNDMNKILTMVEGGSTYIKMHSGHVYHLRNLEIEVLYTHEDIYPWKLEIFNDSSSVIRTTVHNTDGKGNVQGKPTSILWTGDLNFRGSKCAISMYGDYLKSDIVQLAHHGYNGCEYEFYENVSPSIVLYPNRVSSFQSQTDNPNDSTKQYRIDYKVAHVLESVKYILILDTYNTTVTITKDGPDMSIGGTTGLFNAYEGDINPITKYGGAIVKK